jgi:hypothetical protein
MAIRAVVFEHRWRAGDHPGSRCHPAVGEPARAAGRGTQQPHARRLGRRRHRHDHRGRRAPGDHRSPRLHMPAREFPATRRQRVRTAPSPYPPDLSWWAVKGRQALVPLVHLPVSLAGPAPSGSTSTSRHRQGCSRPPRRLPDQAALSFTRPLRRPGGKGLSPPLDLRRLVAHMPLSPVDPAEHIHKLSSRRRSHPWRRPGPRGFTHAP